MANVEIKRELNISLCFRDLEDIKKQGYAFVSNVDLDRAGNIQDYYEELEKVWLIFKALFQSKGWPTQLCRPRITVDFGETPTSDDIKTTTFSHCQSMEEVKHTINEIYVIRQQVQNGEAKHRSEEEISPT